MQRLRRPQLSVAGPPCTAVRVTRETPCCPRLRVTPSSPTAPPPLHRFLGEALRALLTLEVRQLEVVQLVQQDHPPAQLPGGAAAVRCEVRTPGGATATVTLGGPADLLKNKVGGGGGQYVCSFSMYARCTAGPCDFEARGTCCAPCLYCRRSHRPPHRTTPSFSRPSPAQALVQHALRQAMTADAQTLQFKLPPAGVPLPPTHVSPGVASGAPVVEGLAVTSLWTVQLLKLLAQVRGTGCGCWVVCVFERPAHPFLQLLTSGLCTRRPVVEQPGGAPACPHA